MDHGVYSLGNTYIICFLIWIMRVALSKTARACRHKTLLHLNLQFLTGGTDRGLYHTIEFPRGGKVCHRYIRSLKTLSQDTVSGGRLYPGIKYPGMDFPVA